MWIPFFAPILLAWESPTNEWSIQRPGWGHCHRLPFLFLFVERGLNYLPCVENNVDMEFSENWEKTICVGVKIGKDASSA